MGRDAAVTNLIGSIDCVTFARTAWWVDGFASPSRLESTVTVSEIEYLACSPDPVVTLDEVAAKTDSWSPGRERLAGRYPDGARLALVLAVCDGGGGGTIHPRLPK